MNINEMSIEELKVLGYDLMGELERVQSNLRMVSGKIAELSNPQPEKEDVKEEVKNAQSEEVAEEIVA